METLKASLDALQARNRVPNERPRTDMERNLNSMRKRSGDNIMKTMIVMGIAAAAVIRRADTNSVGLNSLRLANTISAISKPCQTLAASARSP